MLFVKPKTETLTVLFVDLNQGFVGLLCSGKIVLVLQEKDENRVNLRGTTVFMMTAQKREQHCRSGSRRRNKKEKSLQLILTDLVQENSADHCFPNPRESSNVFYPN